MSLNTRRRHKIMERVLKKLLGANTPNVMKFGDTYDSIELPTGVTKPTQSVLEAEFNQAVADEDEHAMTQIQGDIQIGTSNLYVDVSTGRVGIKTDTPAFDLDVNGNARVVGTLTATNISANGAALTNIPSSAITGGTFSQWTTVNSDINYSGGNVGIGINPSYKLHVNGGVYASGNVGIGVNPSHKLHVSGDIFATGNVTAYSDKRAKSDIKKIKDALEKVEKLSGYTYMMNDKKYTGLIAQEVLPVLPEAVTGSEETNYGIAYGNMMGLIVEAIKEIKEKLRQLGV